MVYFRFVMYAVILTVTSLGAAERRTSHPLASDHEVELYLSLYSASLTRGLRFSNATEPHQAVREEIFLESALARRAERNGLSTEPVVLNTLEMRADAEVLNTWLRHQVGDKVTTPQIEAYYREHSDEFTRPEAVTFHHLFLLVPPSDTDAARKKREKAEHLLNQARQGSSFEQLIREHSELATAKEDGGKAGPVETSRLNPALREAIQRLSPGELSDPVRTPYGWELVRLDERTSAALLPIQEVRERIREHLLRQEAERIQQSASEHLARKYPAQIHESVLSGTGPLTTDAVVLSLGERKWTVGDLLQELRVREEFRDVSDPRERIRLMLPRVIQTEQIKLAARDAGLLESPDFQTKLRFIRNRLLAEEYLRNYRTSQEPTEEQLRAAYEAEKEVFRGPPYAKGILYRWNLPAETAGTTSPGELAFQRNVLLQRVTKLVAGAREGRISREQLASNADQTTSLDWFREGPMGYHHDMAWFKTEPGQFTEPYFTRNSLSVGWVEQRRQPEQIPFEQAREQVRIRLISRWSQEERKALIEEILRNVPGS